MLSLALREHVALAYHKSDRLSEHYGQVKRMTAINKTRNAQAPTRRAKNCAATLVRPETGLPPLNTILGSLDRITTPHD
ncbi:hypothetical protein GCM10011348_25930 [Marinobacterium nitratireducens]|uniref:Uncharacterized protein n=1 Tax=Marinobacterium nitratireducens TaxID=518897 RepID=A0A918DTB3_9GAMM|nr:hypothetical protein GCM10011348_25930 [Marinobacterium nitratireducens]